MREIYKNLYLLLPNINREHAYKVKNYERRICDIIILGMGRDTAIFNISSGFYTDSRYNENATNVLIRDIAKIGEIADAAAIVVKNNHQGKRTYFERACSLCNNDADYKYKNGIYVCSVCHSSFINGIYGYADIEYFYKERRALCQSDNYKDNITSDLHLSREKILRNRKSGIYYINDERIKIIYSYGDAYYEHITIRRDCLYSKYISGKIEAYDYCNLCVVNKKDVNDLCDVCDKVLWVYRWKRVLPMAYVVLYMLDAGCEVKLCWDVKKYCLLFL